MRSRLLAALVALIVGAPLLAAPPTVTRVMPNGAERGKPVEIVVAGANLTPQARLVLPFKATQAVVAEVKPNPAQLRVQLTIDATVPPGAYPARLLSEEGLSAPFFFCVDLFPGVVEVEDNSSFERAQRVPVPVIVHGECAGGDIDFFRFEAKKGQRLVIETESARLGSGILPQLRLTDSRNRFVAADDSTALRGDGRIIFNAPADGEYVIEVSDTRFRGAAPPFYRLKIADYDVFEEVFPLGGRRGEAVTFTLRGGTLTGEARVQRTLEDGLFAGRTFLPLDGVGKPGLLSPLVAVGDVPERLWIKSDGKEPRSLDVLPPLTVNGRLEHKGDADRFQFAVQEGQRYHIEVQAEALGSHLDGVLRVSDQAGKQLALVDDVDVPSPVPGQLPLKAADPSLDFTVPAGVSLLQLELRDQRHRGGVNFGYRLTIVPAVADFELHAAATELNVPRGGSAAVSVAVTRRGYMGPIQLSVPVLPAGLTVQGGQVPANGTLGVLTVSAAADAAAGTEPALLRIAGKATSDGKELQRWAEPRLVLSKEAASTVTLPGLATALRSAEPFGVQAPPTVEVVKGYATPLAVTLTRGPTAAMVPIEMQATVPLTALAPGQPLPPGTFTLPPASVAAGATSAALTLTPGPNAPEGLLTLLVQGKAKIANVDLVVVAPAATLTVRPPFTLETATPELLLTPGQAVALKGKIVRQAVFKEAVTLNLTGLPAGVTLAAPLQPVTGNEFTIDLKVDPKFAVPAATMTLNATTTIAGTAYPQPAVSVAAKKP